MMFKALLALGALATFASAQTATKGKAFDHVFIIWLENTDFARAATTPDLQALLPKGVFLNSYYGVTHPSEPNYMAVAGGDYWGIVDDDFHAVPANTTTIVDLLEAKGLTWKAYQEDFPGNCYPDLQFNGTYFRKHNPFIVYDSIATNATRCAKIVPSTELQADLANDTLPNYSFFTPNMANDGHNTTVQYAANWLTGFLAPLLNNTSFLKNTLVVVTFDETETYTVGNNVWTILLGDAVPQNLLNTTDSTFYTHYSLLSTVEANWDLGNLGRNDVNKELSNVFDFVAKLTNYTNTNVTDKPLLNGTAAVYGNTTTTSNSTSSGNGTSATPSSSSGAQIHTSLAVVFAGVAALAVAML